MRGDPERARRQFHRLQAYLADEDVPVEERGQVMVALMGHAYIYLLLTLAWAIWAAITGVRVWRRREAGLLAAMKTGVHKPTLGVLLAARLIYMVLRRVGLAKLNRRTDRYTAHTGNTA